MSVQDDRLRLVFWELTAACNLSCRHCRAQAPGARLDGELTAEEIVRAARSIRETADPIIVLTGGEPLARPDIFEIAGTLTGIFSRVALATNGTLVDPATARKLAETGVQRVSVSLDGASARTHDTFRGQEGSFERALQGIDALRRENMSLQVNVTLTRHNVAELDALLDLALSLGADAFHVFVLVPVGCGAELPREARLSGPETERALRWLCAQSMELRDSIHIKATCAPQYYRIMQQIRRDSGDAQRAPAEGMNAVTRGCLAGTSVCFVSRTGDVQPCGYLPARAGNVRESSFPDIWRHSGVFETLRSTGNLSGKCGACEFIEVCGGCRARAFAESGDFMGEEPGCAYVPGRWAVNGLPA